VDGIREALHDALRDDPRVLILGEDVCDPYGGAFKVTVGLSARFPDRVFNTPISEAAIVGTGCGLALDGWLPVVEIMFGDFLLLAADQWVNHAAKLAWMYNDKVRVPMIVRTPMGGYRGYGPTHSQSLEKHLLGVPGTTVWALHHRHCPRCFYRNLLREVTGPALVLENKLLYARHATCETPPGWSLETFLPGTCETGGPPTGRGVSGGTMTRMRGPREPQLTLLAYGGMAPLAEAAAMQLWNQEELACELIFPVQLYPLTIEPIRASVERTGHLLIVEEGQGFAAWGSEVIAQLTEERQDSAFSHGLVTRSTHGTGIRISRVHAKACPIPGSRPAELQVLPSEAEIIAAGIHLVTR
jgi:pyruvate/2-oxoglutarate/acetoin dehydrogenase E1 component